MSTITKEEKCNAFCKIYNEKYLKDGSGIKEMLYNGDDYLDIIFNFLFMRKKLNIPIFTYTRKIEKGTTLYKIRKYNEIFDINNEKEWEANPKKTQSRLNKQNESALYLSSSPELCKLELNILEQEKYAIAEFVVQEDFFTKTFFMKQDFYKADMIINAFISSPIRSKENQELFDFLDQKFEKANFICEKDFYDLSLSFKIAHLMKKGMHYDVSCELADCLKPAQAILYNSVYTGLFSTMNIKCNFFNICFFESGQHLVKFKNAKIEKMEKPNDKINLVKLLTDLKNNYI